MPRKNLPVQQGEEKRGMAARGINHIFRIVLIAGMVATPVLSASDAIAANDGTLIEGAKLCTRFLPRNERKYGIPLHLLSAIATTESGRWHNGLNMALPWPWTVNVEGKGYYFDSKQQAISFVQSQQAKGISSMDVGCMQVNLRHHPKAFANLAQAFEPAANVDYAAQFLRSNYDEQRSWRKAAAAYHSRTPALGNKYIGSVFASWQRIITKVREARIASGSAPARNATPTELAMITPPAGTGLPKTASAVTRAAYKPIRMRVIEVRSGDTAARVTREQGVKVIRASSATAEDDARKQAAKETETQETAVQETEIAQATMASASVSSEVNFVTQLGATGKVIRVNAETNAKSGPRFIFN